MNFSIHEIKTTARGRWTGILIDAGLPAGCLDGRGHPCPLCGGEDRFNTTKDVKVTGAAYCRNCFNRTSTIKPGDGVATVAWLLKSTNSEAAKWIADRLGMNGERAAAPVDTITASRNKESLSRQARIVATYDYKDATGELLFQAVRYEPKDFRQRKPDGKGGWTWSVKGSRVVPYRLPDLLAKPAEPVFIPEGEKDCDNLARIGLIATCNAGGAGKWTAEHAAYLRDRHIVVIADNDEPGRKHSQQVAQLLHGIASSIKIVELPNLPPKGDLTDWLAAGGNKTELESIVEATAIWKPEQQAWPELMPFDAIELPEFPTCVLPPVLRDWVESESHATQTPADLAAQLSLAVCSACIARRVVVEPRTGWIEPVNLFTAILLDPGNRKSAVFSDAMKPLRELEVELIENARPDDIDPALTELVRRGYIRPKPTKSIGPGRPASPAYEVNPVTFESTKPESRSAYSKNSPVSNGEPNLQNIQSAISNIEAYSGRPQTDQLNESIQLSNESGLNGSVGFGVLNQSHSDSETRWSQHSLQPVDDSEGVLF